MAMHKGEIYRCPDAECGCEIEVIQGPAEMGGDESPRCCCGMAMKLTEGAEL